MKTKINDTYVDLSEIQAIGALIASRPEFGRDGRDNKFGFNVFFKGMGAHPFWIEATGEAYDPYNLSSDVNNAAAARAKVAYDKFVSDWQNIDV